MVGSRASGTAKPNSDFDYVITNLKNKDWKKIKNSLPGAKNIDNPRRIDIFKNELDELKPYIQIIPD